MPEKTKKIICVIGPTASGKTGLAVKLAWFYGGEIVSADSRQVYRYMDIGTGKDLPDYLIKTRQAGPGNKNRHRFETVRTKNDEYYKIPCHLIDIVHPNTPFDLAKFLKKADSAINSIQKRGRVPIVCGGSGLYVQALVDGYGLSPAKPDKALRARLEKASTRQLLARLKRLDAAKYDSLNQSEQGNQRRLIRYIEIAAGRKAKAKAKTDAPDNAGREYLVLGVRRGRDESKKLIRRRLIRRLEKEGMVEEVRRLHYAHRVSWRRLAGFGLEYKHISSYLQGKIGYEAMVAELEAAICRFAKRQMSWYRRWERQGRKIHWAVDYAAAKRAINQKAAP